MKLLLKPFTCHPQGLLSCHYCRCHIKKESSTVSEKLVMSCKEASVEQLAMQL